MQLFSFIYLIGAIIFGNIRPILKNPDEKVIRDFMTYVQSPDWNIDTIDTKYIVDYPVDTTAGAKVQRQKFLRIMAVGLRNHLKNVDVANVAIFPYQYAAKDLQILKLEEGYLERSYIASDSKSFTRYFLVKNGKIHAFDVLQKTFLIFD